MMLLKQKSLIISSIALTVGGSVAIAKPSFTSYSFARTPVPTPIKLEEPAFEKGKLLEQLNLSDRQKQKLAQIHQQFQPKVAKLNETMQTEQIALRNMIVGTDSEVAIRTKHQELLDLRQSFDELRFESILAMREVLTPQQRTQFSQMMRQQREQLHGRFGDRFD